MDEALCQVCEKGFEDEEDIIGVTGATISDANDAIIPDDQPWLILCHQKCWEMINNAWREIMGKGFDTPKTSDTEQPN